MPTRARTRDFRIGSQYWSYTPVWVGPAPLKTRPALWYNVRTMSDASKPPMPPEAFLFVEPHAGYDPAEAASGTAAPSLSRLELAWERLLRRKYLLEVVQGRLSAAVDAHASRKSLCRFLRPGSPRPDSTGRDGRDVAAQSGYDDVVSDFNEFLRSSLEWFVLEGDAGVDRGWTSGVGSSEVFELGEWSYGTGEEPYSRYWTESSDEPQYSMPQVAFRTLAEAWLRTPPRVSLLGVSEGIGHDGDPVVSDRTYTVPRWGSSLPEDDVEGVSSVEVDGVPRTVPGSVSGYGVNDGQFRLDYLTHDALRRRQRESAGYCHEYLGDIPPRAPTVYPVAEDAPGMAAVRPAPSVAVTRYADEGWESADVGRMPPRLVPSVSACFVPPALVPCLRAEFPPPDGWRCGMASEHAGVPYGRASDVKSPLRTLYRAAADCMDAWLSRASRTATAFGRVLWDFDSRSEWRRERESRSVYDNSDSSTGHHHSETSSSSWDESYAEAHGSVAAGCGADQFGALGPGTAWTGGFGVLLSAPSASGSASYSLVSRRTYTTESGDNPPRSSESVFLDTEETRRTWRMSVRLSSGVPVWRAPWSYDWRRRTASSDQEPDEVSGTDRGTGDEERVLPPEFMPFVRRAEVFAVVTAEAGSSDPVDGPLDEESESHSVGSEAWTYESGSSRRSHPARASERKLVSLGVLDESGALPPLGLGGLLAMCPQDPGSGSAPSDGGSYGDDLVESRSATVNGEDAVVDQHTRRTRTRDPNGYRRVNGNGEYLLLVDWDFDAEHDPFAASGLNALWKELAEAGRERAAALAARDDAAAALWEAESALSAAEAGLAALEAELASLNDGGESAGRLAELGSARDAAASALSAAEAARAAADAAELGARAALAEAEAAEEPDEAEVGRLRAAYSAARGAVMEAERAEESARAALASAEAALKRYRDLVDAVEGAREALEGEIAAAEGRVSSAEAAVAPARRAKDDADAAYGAADEAYAAILARIRSATA